MGDAIEGRLRELQLSRSEFSRLSGVSPKTLVGYIAGQPIKNVKKRRELLAALGWDRTSIERILAGGEPLLTDHPPPGVPTAADPDWRARTEHRLAVLEAAVSSALGADRLPESPEAAQAEARRTMGDLRRQLGSPASADRRPGPPATG